MTRILVIEDNPATRELIVRTLKDQYEMLEADNGITGIDIALKHMPDLILCDISMPQMDGFEVLRRLREHTSTATTTFIFLTAFSDLSSMRQGMNLGADDYIAKPFTPVEVRQAVETRLKKKEQQVAQVHKALEELRHNITLSLPHELRTAIMVIEGYSHLMLEGEDSESERYQMLKSISQYANRLHQMAEKFLWYSKTYLYTESIQRGYPDTPAREVIEKSAIELAAQLFRADDLTINIEPSNVRMIDECLEKIVIEVVENAFKFSSTGTKVIVQGQVQEDRYMLKVIDYGRGMTREQIDLIGGFMQFERSLQEQQGTGLGLIIARRLTEIFDGKFMIHSVPERGTVISISIPRPLTEDKPDAPVTMQNGKI